MPTQFVGLHLALAALLALVGLTFITDPCGGGGDLCLGGALGLYALGVAGLGVVGLLVWSFGRRASPLLVWDSALLALAGFIVLANGTYAPTLILVSAIVATILALSGAVLAGRAVAAHRIERLLAVAVFVAIAAIGGGAGIVVLILGLLALAAGWLQSRQGLPPATGAPRGPGTGTP